MKRFLSLIILIVLISSLSGCGANNSGNSSGGLSLLPAKDNDKIERLAFSTSKLELLTAETRDIEVSVQPSDLANISLQWASSDTKIATVTGKTATATIKAISAGEAKLTVSSKNGCEAVCTIIVRDPVVVDSVRFSTDQLALINGESEKLSVSILPNNADDKSLVWSSSNEAVVKVADDGTVTAIGVGTATITGTAGNGVTGQCEISVRDPIMAEEVRLSETEISVMVGKTVALDVTVLPENADEKRVTWSSSDDSVAFVINGVVTGQKEGFAVVTATTANGVRAECTVTVYEMTAERMEELLKNEPLYVESTKYIVQDTRYKNLYPDMLQAVIRNQSGANIKDAVVAFVAWDENKLPVKIKGDIDFSGGSYIKRCGYNNINLIPNASYGKKSGMEIDDSCNIKIFKAIAVSYTDFDGNTWENPYYEDWCKLFEGKVLK